MQLRRATVEDARAITELNVRGWRTSYRGIFSDAFLDGLDVEQKTAQRAERLGSDGSYTLLAESEGRLSGFCNLVPSRDADARPGTAEIAGIYVEPTAKRSGAGRLLFEACAAEARRRGFDRLSLWVLAENEGARAFYRRLGMAPDGTEVLEERLPLAPGRERPVELRYVLELERPVPVVRLARPVDAQAIATISVRSWRAAYGHIVGADYLRAMDADGTAAGLAGRLKEPDRSLWVAELEGSVVGFVRMDWARADWMPGEAPGLAELGGMNVDPAWQGAGLGRTLTETAVEAARERKCRHLLLWVFAENSGARAFYERVGWRFDGTAVPEPRVPGVEGRSPLKVRYRRGLER